MARRRAQLKGELRNTGGSWAVRYRVDTTLIDPKTGKPKRERIWKELGPSIGDNALSKNQARQAAAKFLLTINQWAVRPSSMHTLSQFYTVRYDPDVIAHMKKSSQSFYRSIITVHILPALGTIPMRDLTRGRVQEFFNAKLKQTTPALKVSSVGHIKKCLAGMLRHARRHDWFLGDLPTEGIRLPQQENVERQALTWEQVCKLAKKLPEPVRTLVVLLTVTGLRIGEATGLRWKHLNLTEEVQIVDGEVIPPLSIAVRENWVRGERGTLKTRRSSYRNVPLPVWFVPTLAKMARRKKWAKPTDPVFANPTTGNPLNDRNLDNRVLKPVAKAMKPPLQVSWHILRHTNATLAEIAGMTLTERQRVLGHTATETTKRYSHADLSVMRPRLETMVDPALLKRRSRGSAAKAEQPS